MRNFVTILLCLFFCSVFGQDEGIWLHPNRGQWDSPILYKVELNSGEMFIEKNGFTYALNDFKSQMSHKHTDKEHVSEDLSKKNMHAHVIRSTFLGSSWKGERKEKQESGFHRNYFQGSDRTRWKSNLKSFHTVEMTNFYPNIDLFLNGTDHNLKYSFIAAAYANVSKIKYQVKGGSKLFVDEYGNFHITTIFGEIIDSKPIAWNLIDGKKRTVRVRYLLEDDVISFQFPEGYDSKYPLVIDPSLTFSTFTGSTADNWGLTATPDSQGNLYAGGIVFNDGGTYPTTTGAFDVTFNGGDINTLNGANSPGIDIAITKFNAGGTAMIYSTFMGGSGNEAPHSLVCGENDELFIMGVTGSPNFPTSVGSFDNTFNGGPQFQENGLFYNGSDIFVAKLSANGSTLLGSTYVGGSGSDGVNIGELNFNYGDPFRGEIIDGGNGFIYVASSTRSSDFPTVNSSQASLNGIQDAAVFKMNSSLSSMAWSTYFGGSGLESGNSIQISSLGEVFVAGGTNSSQLPIVSGNDLVFNGGVSDGYLTRFNGVTGVNIIGTFMGLNEYDQAYFVQIDKNDDIYVFGQTESNWPITAGLYGTPNSGQFIRKYTNNLETILWTTMIGAGSGHVEISPTAFLVSDCFDIYLSGWGGAINSNFGNQAANSSSNGFEVTSDAFQSTTNGSNFYIAVLDQDAAYLKYGTYMGGVTASYNHVDGGTSRFDKSGRIYHAVCGACGGDNFGFTTTPGVVGPQNISSNCNLAAFKFELNKILPVIGEPEPLICLPDPVIFNNSSANGNTFFWDFGDNTTSNLINPTHLYAGPGVYVVQLIVSDSNNCFSADSIVFELNIGDFEGGVTTPPGPVCPGVPFQLDAFGGAYYSWSPGNLLNNDTISNPIATVYETTDFTVIISDSCGVDTLFVTLQVFDVNIVVCNDTSVCIGNNAFLYASGGNNYSWSPSTFLNNTAIANPICSATTNILYSLEVTTFDGCTKKDTVEVAVFFDPPIPVLLDTVLMCKNSPLTITAGGADEYTWTPNFAINNLSGAIVTVSPPDDFTYYCLFKNACGTANDSIFLDVIAPVITAGNDTIVCPNNPAFLWSEGGQSYRWMPASSIENPNSQDVTVNPQISTMYYVIGTDEFGCSATDSVFVQLYVPPVVDAGIDKYAFLGDLVELNATSTSVGTYQWSPPDYLNCADCAAPLSNPDLNYTYMVTLTDLNGCNGSDEVKIFYEGVIYVPNTFTPGENINSLFKAEGGNIKTFEMLIFNRWGELIYTIDDFDKSWNGKHNGIDCQDGTYTWKITYSDFNDKRGSLVGHVNLIR